jgi:glycerol uptake facilitator-like aquaporin
MDLRLLRQYFVELIGTLAFVYFASGLAILNFVTNPSDSGSLTVHQPGLVGVALGQGLVWAALLAWTVPISGGYLNPAIAFARWLFDGLSTVRFAWFLGAQLLGAVIACFLLRLTFDSTVLTPAHYGRPYLNPLVYGGPMGMPASTGWSGLGLEFVLTFFLALAIFGPRNPAPAAAGAMLAVCVLFGTPLTGAGLNPVRWIGPIFWEAVDRPDSVTNWRSALAYLGGPVAGALLAAIFCVKVYRPALAEALPRK